MKWSSWDNLGNNSLSYVLTAKGLSSREAESTIRVSLNRFTTKEDIDIFIKELRAIK